MFRFFLGNKEMSDEATADSTAASASASATGGGGGGDSILPKQARKKVILGKGYSLMDWIRVTKENPNIAGNFGVIRDITLEELARHNTQDDCWVALFGKVYNVTPYLKFHPGGVDELMRGAGKDATDLFNEIHSWVNLNGMLEKCLIGRLVASHPK